jgi:muramoyltetrapeptide carboxypeptidase
VAKLKAPALKPGDTIGIIAPASPPRNEERIERSVRYFERLGYRVELGKNIRDGVGYLAAPDKERLADLHAMFRSKRVKAIFYHRGGFGSIRLLDKIDYDLIRRNPKIVVGYSDATSLFCALHKKAGLASCFFGPMPGVDLWGEVDPFTEEHFWRAVTSCKPGSLSIPENTAPLTPLLGKERGTATGRMIGGNLTVFCSLLGTPYQPSFRNCIPFLEEIDEKPRKIDAYLAQLRLAGMFDDAQAILLGKFTNCDTDPDAPTLPLAQIFEHYFGKLKVPVLSDLPFGHEKQMWTLPFGAKLRIDKGGVAVIEGVLA